MLRSIKVWSKWTKTSENVTCRVSGQYWSLHRYITLPKRRSLASFFLAGLCQCIQLGAVYRPVKKPVGHIGPRGMLFPQRKVFTGKNSAGLWQQKHKGVDPWIFTGRLFNTTSIGPGKSNLMRMYGILFLSDLCGIWCIVWVGVIIVMTPCFYVRIPSNSQWSSGWGHSFSESNEQWKKAWLFRVFRGLYYPVMWGL